jgi:hypothetical protein
LDIRQVSAAPRSPLADDGELAFAESAIRDFMQAHMLDVDGLVLSHLNADTLRPWTAADMAGNARPSFCHAHCPDIEAFMAYEDSLMATGELAHAQTLRFAVTGDASARAAAARHIDVLLRVFDAGAKFEPGFLPKPFGGLARCATLSHELSPDQYIKVMAAFDVFLPFADTKTADRIRHYTVEAAEYFRAREFCHPRRERMIVTPENRPHVVAHCVMMLLMAARASGDSSYLGDLSRFDDTLDAVAGGAVAPQFNIGSLWFEALHVATRHAWADARWPAIAEVLWQGHAERVHADGGGHNGHAPELTTSRVVRVAAFAPLAAHACPALDTAAAATRVLRAHSEPLQLRYVQEAAAEQLPAGRRYLARTMEIPDAQL